MKLIDFLLPSSCLICDQLVHFDPHNMICTNCVKKITWVEQPRCDKCCIPFEFNLFKNNVCQNCIYDQWNFEKLFAVTSYDQFSAKIAIKLKYKGIGAKFIAHNIWRVIDQPNNPVMHLITYVPLHPLRALSRGFNQAKMIAQALARIMNIPCKELLIRTKNTISQDKLGQQERMNNMKDAFVLKKTEQLLNLNVLIIDDVVTTNATIESCSKVLKAANCNVFGGCWAKRILYSDDHEEPFNMLGLIT